MSEKAKPGFAKSRKQYSTKLLTRIARCGLCGGTFTVVSGGRYKKYGCTTNWNKGVCSNTAKIKAEVLEEAVIAVLCRELSEKDPIDLLPKELHVSIHDLLIETHQGRNKDEVEQELASVQQELSNIQQAIRAGIITETTERLLVKAEEREKALLNERTLLAYETIEDIKLTELLSAKDLQEYFPVLRHDIRRQGKIV